MKQKRLNVNSGITVLQGGEDVNVAHLLGHFVNGHGDQLEDVKNFSDQATGIEKIANVFASDILVPRRVLKFLVANGKTNITELAKFFAASEVLVASQIERIFK